MSVMTKREIARLLRVSERTIDTWRKMFGLPMRKVGQVCRFDEEEVLAWFQRFREGGGQ